MHFLLEKMLPLPAQFIRRAVILPFLGGGRVFLSILLTSEHVFG